MNSALATAAALVPHGTMLDLAEDTVNAAWNAGQLATMASCATATPTRATGAPSSTCPPASSTCPPASPKVSSGITKAANAPNRVAYAMVKAALDALGRAAAMERAADAIRVNTTMPFVRTDAVTAFLEHEPEQTRLDVMLSRRARVPRRRGTSGRARHGDGRPCRRDTRADRRA